MTEFTGSILELNGKKAIILTDTCDFVSIQRQPEMFVGQQIKFKKSDVNSTNKNYMRYFALAASVFLIVLCSVFYFQIFVPSTVFAYIDVDINPSLEFVINKNAKVLDIEPLNNDAKILLQDLKLVDLPVKEAIAEVVKTSKQLGFISASKNDVVLISASVDVNKDYSQNGSEQKTLDNILSDLGSVTFDVGTENIKPDVLKVTPENRKSAIKNNISMGRYALYSKIKKENKDITVEKAKTERVSEMIKQAKIKGLNKNKTDDSKNSDSKNTNSRNNASKNTDSKDTSSKSTDSKDTGSKSTHFKGNKSKSTHSNGNSLKDTHSKETSYRDSDSKNTDSTFTNSKSANSKSNNSSTNNSYNSKVNKNKETTNSNSFSEKELLTENDNNKNDTKSNDN